MMKAKKFLLLTLTGFLTLSAAHAATITWSLPQTISGDSDVSTTGTFNRAYNFGGSDPFVANVTVNSVVFTTVNSGSSGADTFSFGGGTNGTSGFYSSTTGAFTTLSSSYQVLMGSGRYQDAPVGGTSTQTITLNNLMAGYVYQVQIWVNDSRGPTSGRTETVSAGNNVTLAFGTGGVQGSLGQFVTGTFTADTTSQAITFSSTSSAQVNALQLRQIAIPEPTSSLLLATGLLGLTLRRVRR